MKSFSHKPKRIVELGGGLSTLLIAYALEKIEHGHVTAVDHLEPFATQTQHRLAQHGLKDRVDVIHAPLELTHLPHGTWQ